MIHIMDISHVPSELALDDHSCHGYVPCFPSDKQLIFSHGDEAVRTRHGAMITWLQPGWQWMAVLQHNVQIYIDLQIFTAYLQHIYSIFTAYQYCNHGVCG